VPNVIALITIILSVSIHPFCPLPTVDRWPLSLGAGYYNSSKEGKTEGSYAPSIQTLSNLGAVWLLNVSHHSHLEPWGNKAVEKLAEPSP